MRDGRHACCAEASEGLGTRCGGLMAQAERGDAGITRIRQRVLTMVCACRMGPMYILEAGAARVRTVAYHHSEVRMLADDCEWCE